VKDYDVIVVGGGINGLTAAAYLAKAGLSVRSSRRVASAARTATPSSSVFLVSCTAPTRRGWFLR